MALRRPFRRSPRPRGGRLAGPAVPSPGPAVPAQGTRHAGSADRCFALRPAIRFPQRRSAQARTLRRMNGGARTPMYRARTLTTIALALVIALLPVMSIRASELLSVAPPWEGKATGQVREYTLTVSRIK